MIIVKNYYTKDGYSGYSGMGPSGYSGDSGYSGEVGMGDYIGYAEVGTVVTVFNNLLNELKHAGIMAGAYVPPG